MLITGFCCVQRVSDIYDLRQRNLVTEGNALRLQFVQSKGTRIAANGRRKDGFAVDMILPDPAAQWITLHPGKPTPERFLFVCETTGTRWHEKTASRVFARVLAALVKERPSLRHLLKAQLRDCRRSGFVQYMIDTNSDVAAVCSISGHSIAEGMAILEHYNPKTPEQADSAVARSSLRL